MSISEQVYWNRLDMCEYMMNQHQARIVVMHTNGDYSRMNSTITQFFSFLNLKRTTINNGFVVVDSESPEDNYEDNFELP